MNINEMIFNIMNSKDIAEHLKNIGYQFTLPEAAFLVWSSHSCTLAKKFEMWEMLMKAMPDCSMPERLNMMAIGSFHKFLKDYICLLKQKISYFKDKENSVYFYSIHESGDTYAGYEQPFSSFEVCLEAVKKYMSEYPSDNYDEIRIKKQPLNMSNDFEGICETVYNKDLKLMSVRRNSLTGAECDIALAFEGMWFLFPTPFKKGDIVTERHPVIYEKDYGYCNVPIVLSSAVWSEEFINEIPKYRERRQKLLERLRKNGDFSDMTYSAYYIAEEGFYKENGNDYLSLEYYRQPLTDENRFLKALSMYLNDECSLDFLIDAKDIIFGEKKIKERKRYLNQLDEIIKSVGIER